MWSLRRGFQFKEWMWMGNGVLALGTEVKVFADRALVADSNDWGGTAAITDIAFVDNLILVDVHLLMLHW